MFFRPQKSAIHAISTVITCKETVVSPHLSPIFRDLHKRLSKTIEQLNQLILGLNNEAVGNRVIKEFIIAPDDTEQREIYYE